MASRVTTRSSAGEVAWEYLASHHPEMASTDLSVLELGGGWLVETVPMEGGVEDRVLLMVNRHGFVEEMGAGPGTRQSARRGLAALQGQSERVIQL